MLSVVSWCYHIIYIGVIKMTVPPTLPSSAIPLHLTRTSAVAFSFNSRHERTIILTGGEKYHVGMTKISCQNIPPRRTPWGQSQFRNFALHPPKTPANTHYTFPSRLCSTSAEFNVDVLDPSSVSKIPLSQLLQMLNEYNVRYAPDSTRCQLEQKLLNHLDQIEAFAQHEPPSNVLENQHLPSSNEESSPELSSSDTGEKSQNSLKVDRVSANVVDAVVLNNSQDSSVFSPDDPIPRNHQGRRNPGRKDNNLNDGRRPHNRGQSQRKRRQPSTYSQQDAYSQGWHRTQRRHREPSHRRDFQYSTRRDLQDERHRHYNQRRYQNDFGYSNDSTYDFYNNDVIDIDTFDLDDDAHWRRRPSSEEADYENGLQIFLMGFLEAGKTATELALEAAGSAINPFHWDRGHDGEWWYDEERGRDVLDVNVLDESRYRSRRVRSYEDDWRHAYSSTTPQRKPRRYKRQQSNNVYRRPRYEDNSEEYYDWRQGRQTDPDYYQRKYEGEEYSAKSKQSHKTQSGSTDMTNNEPSHFRTTETPSTKNANESNRQKPRVNVNKNGSAKPIYGLYSDGIPTEGNSETAEIKERQTKQNDFEDQPPHHHYKHRHWKDRLRQKFDAALGLQSPSPSQLSSSSNAYYDSWKNQMEEIDDDRKEKLRRKMKETSEPMESSPESPPTPPSTEPPSSSTPKNRRSRARLNKRVSQKNPPQSSSRRKSKLRLDEAPFWRREGGTLASLIFDSRPPLSSAGGGGSKTRNRSFEQLFLSSAGRDNALTSIVLYVARSSLSVFGNLCRWAGVRGTIPQPIVATTVFAVAISSRRGYRIYSLGLTLLALRMVGEFIHGSLYGNEFWDDDYDPVTHEWVKEGGKDEARG